MALVDVVQLIKAQQPKTVSLKESKKPHQQFDDKAIAARLKFAQRIRGSKPSLKDEEIGAAVIYDLSK